MKKIDMYMKNEFRRIRKENEKNEIDVMKMIFKFGNKLINIKQM